MVLFGKKERVKAGQLKIGTKKTSERGRAFSCLIMQDGGRVNTLDVSKVEAQSRSDSLQRDVQACIRFAARSERMAPAGRSHSVGQPRTSNQERRRVIQAMISSALHSIARRNRLEKESIYLF